ncbi:hypothetical protein [Salipaludibacillus sp. CF4.18]|uniref:hypothetical protein n=1 Tax=Salipaludibacillus sp. CF4.18 TaxID=3373081 RepID=UPI003EE61708
MSTHNEFIAERDKIDFLIDQGYRITAVTENLSGDLVEFQQVDESGVLREKKETTSLLIMNANARKYFSTLMMEQQR